MHSVPTLQFTIEHEFTIAGFTNTRSLHKFTIIDRDFRHFSSLQSMNSLLRGSLIRVVYCISLQNECSQAQIDSSDDHQPGNRTPWHLDICNGIIDSIAFRLHAIGIQLCLESVTAIAFGKK